MSRLTQLLLFLLISFRCHRLVAAFSLATLPGADKSKVAEEATCGFSPLALQRLSLPSSTRTTTALLATTEPKQLPKKRPYQHVMAILSVPYTSIERIANEAILETAIASTDKLSVVLRCQGSRKPPSLLSLRRYIGEIYSMMWDLVMDDFSERGVIDVVVYPQNLPNTAPESWIDIQPDLDCVCTHDSLCGWVSEDATGRGLEYMKGAGQGGLKEHVKALNAERERRKLRPVVAMEPDTWPTGAQIDTTQQTSNKVIFLDDDPNIDSELQSRVGDGDGATTNNNNNLPSSVLSAPSSFLGGAPIAKENALFESVAVGGTFDGLHFGHRKLLTMAVSSVQPMTGRLLVGITVDEMLRHKECADQISNFKDRSRKIEEFLKRLAPGMLNRVKLVPITDKFGPPGQPDMYFDALVLSHEVLETGYQLNEHRASIGLEPLSLLCTRRTEAKGMSSTALRKARQRMQL